MSSGSRAAELPFLNGVTVLEISGRVAGAYCGRLLNGMGAHVTRLDVPISAYAADAVRPMLAQALNRGKESVSAEDDRVAELAATADVVVVDVLHEDPADGRLTDLAQRLLANRPADAAIVDITQFGPWDGGQAQAGAPIVTSAAAGASWSIGLPDREPLSLPFDIPDAIAGSEAAGAAALLMLSREPGNWRSARIGIATADAITYYVNQIAKNFAPVGRPWHRDGPQASQSGGSYPAAIFECRNGAAAIMCRQQREWLALLAAMGNPVWSQRAEIQDERLVATVHVSEVDPQVRTWVGQLTLEELLALGREHGFPVAAVRGVDETLEDAQYAQREFFEELPGGPAGTRVPGIPFRLASKPASSRRPGGAPLGAPGAPLRAPGRALRAPGRELGAPGRPLAGLRVLEFTWVWSGPAVSLALATLGADVIKVEHDRRPDSARARGGAIALKRPAVGPRLELGDYFANLNFGKRSLGIDLTSAAGRDLLLRLAAVSDVVVENMRPGTLDRRGLGYEQLSESNPGLVMISMSVAGQAGPLAGMAGYAPVMSGLAGLEALVGYADSPPMGLFNLAFSDPNAASLGVGATLAALLRQRRTGEGAWIDLSQMEGVSGLLSEPLLEAQIGGAARPPANGHTSFSPHGHFRCAGADTWVAVAARTDSERERLTALLEVAADDSLTDALAAWATDRTRHEAVAELRGRGIPAAPLRSYEELQDEGRPTTARIVHPYVGEQLVSALPWSIDDAYLRPQRRAPLLGEQTDTILRDLLSIDDEQIAALREAGVLSPAVEDPDRYPERAGAANVTPGA